ncbi:uncharacterized protein LOC129001762 [Macrosteles quadrilineatus]|uniref:uncharacterized protein LOC129001762 n=1 Tax=Macrosteles quadrilineatus TaxID=74068 RepID=UPI0023E1B81A|nr:uncharacterized protein LOC129001762 [Macrosteles quadrilineatus]
MARDSISMVLLAMTVGGLWNPEDWDSPWKTAAYDVYAKTVDSFQLTYVFLKFMHTYHSKDYKHYSVFVESLFESLYILIITVQRFLLRWDSKKLKTIVENLKGLQNFSHNSQFYSCYEKHAKRINLIFAAGTFVAVIQVFIKLMIGSARDPASEAYWKKKYPEHKLFVDIWLPFDETVSPYYEVVKPLNLVAMLLTCFSLYIFSVIIPIISIRICYHFRSLSHMLENNMIIGRRDVSLAMSNKELIQKRDLRSLIQYHQNILSIMSLINSLFHVIVLLKLLFLSLPILLCALTLSQVIFIVLANYKDNLEISVPYLYSSLLVVSWPKEHFEVHDSLPSNLE